MHYLLGEKEKLSLEVEIISNKNIAPNCVWGKFCIYINSISFGNFKVHDYLSGNIWDMCLKFKKESIPKWTSLLIENDVDIFDEIYKNNFDNENETRNMSLNEVGQFDDFWTAYVISPNSEMEFDESYIFYYLLDDENVRILYKNPESLDIEKVDIDVNYLDTVANQFNDIMNGAILSPPPS
jgi:hypothetical protein